MEEKSLDSAFWTVQSFARQPQTPQYEEVAYAHGGIGEAAQAAPPPTAKGQNGTVVELVPGRPGKKHKIILGLLWGRPLPAISAAGIWRLSVAAPHDTIYNPGYIRS
jgi:hypothetical protein